MPIKNHYRPAQMDQHSVEDLTPTEIKQPVLMEKAASTHSLARRVAQRSWMQMTSVQEPRVKMTRFKTLFATVVASSGQNSRPCSAISSKKRKSILAHLPPSAVDLLKLCARESRQNSKLPIESSSSMMTMMRAVASESLSLKTCGVVQLNKMRRQRYGLNTSEFLRP